MQFHANNVLIFLFHSYDACLKISCTSHQIISLRDGATDVFIHVPFVLLDSVRKQATKMYDMG